MLSYQRNLRNAGGAYAIESVTRLAASFRGSADKGPPRLAMGIAIPREAGGWASGMAAVRKGRMAKTKECERYITERQSKCLVGSEESGRGPLRDLGTWGAPQEGLYMGGKDGFSILCINTSYLATKSTVYPSKRLSR